MPDLSLAHSWTRTDGADDPVLVKAARRDRAAFAALYRRYVTPIYRYLCSRVGNAADAEDLTAQVFMEALEGLPGYRERGSFAAWLFTIARHKAADHHRRGALLLPLDEARDNPGDEEGPLARMVRQESLQQLGALVARLDDEKQELLRLRFAAGLTYGQMAAVVGRSEAAVKMAVHRLLNRLHAEWEVTDE
jgi:RNA polymerase sigma-70 factor, ECF subfamily